MKGEHCGWRPARSEQRDIENAVWLMFCWIVLIGSPIRCGHAVNPLGNLALLAAAASEVPDGSCQRAISWERSNRGLDIVKLIEKWIMESAAELIEHGTQVKTPKWYGPNSGPRLQRLQRHLHECNKGGIWLWVFAKCHATLFQSAEPLSASWFVFHVMFRNHWCKNRVEYAFGRGVWAFSESAFTFSENWTQKVTSCEGIPIKWNMALISFARQNQHASHTIWCAV